ncbi:oxidase [Candidatus Kaiserbacteria bacterium RIFCSPHIGHO2_01_FULL_49_13]|uniref:Oxidase n=1 Tax=Candidatus Kaiserbacteria bacterium RIFCSPHIGHO2_01_FULL_49_13 TaxID=1798477 RepID=A0A1F6CD80_9BACT|nr:MAG: oxidase [Candidatus Kaiserbacteria bacterium RIFCSPHIGHO2_01_FULL_49_13]
MQINEHGHVIDIPEVVTREHQLEYHHRPKGIGDHIAHGLVKFAAFFADAFFANRYGHRAVVLETVAAVPGMVGGMMQHFRSLRHLEQDRGWIHVLLSEAENERMHLMVFTRIARPTMFERLIIVAAQMVFGLSYFLIYVLSTRTAHRLAGYLEEEAIESYTSYLKGVAAGTHKNVPAPDFAIHYWSLSPDARLYDVIVATRQDEMMHRDINHGLADKLRQHQ